MMSKVKEIKVVAYSPDWPIMYQEEAARIKNALLDNCHQIYHIGSTSIPGLAAKPIIDIIMETHDPEKAIAPLEAIGYWYKGEVNIPFRYYFSREQPFEVHLHVYGVGNSEVDLNLKFRNFIISNPDYFKEYEQLKLRLAEEQKKHKDVRPMFSHYTLGKNEFITKVLNLSGFDKLRMMHCTHYAEWEKAKYFRNTYFFDKSTDGDPYTWTFDHEDHFHMTLYKGTQIIGYAHVQRWPASRAALRIMVIDQPLRNQKFGSHLLNVCEQWLKKQGIISLHIQSSPGALKFYEQHHYKPAPFNDPDSYPKYSQDVELAKIL